MDRGTIRNMNRFSKPEEPLTYWDTSPRFCDEK